MQESEYRSLFVSCISEDAREEFFELQQRRNELNNPTAKQTAFIATVTAATGVTQATVGRRVSRRRAQPTVDPISGKTRVPKPSPEFFSGVYASLTGGGGAEGENISIAIDEFVAVFGEFMYDVAPPYAQRALNDPTTYTDMKAFLYIMFRSVDANDDGRISWKELVDYTMEERLQLAGTGEDGGNIVHHYNLTKTYRYNTLMTEDAQQDAAGATSSDMISHSTQDVRAFQVGMPSSNDHGKGAPGDPLSAALGGPVAKTYGGPPRRRKVTWRAQVEAKRRAALLADNEEGGNECDGMSDQQEDGTSSGGEEEEPQRTISKGVLKGLTPQARAKRRFRLMKEESYASGGVDSRRAHGGDNDEATVSATDAAASGAGGDEEEIILAMEPINTLRHLNASQRLLAICKPRQTSLLNPDLSIAGTLPFQASGNAVIGDEMKLPQGSLLVTSHRDQSVKVWSVNDIPRTTQCDFCLEYENQCPILQSAVTWWGEDRPDVLFSGGVRGDMRQWRFDHEILSDYRRGDVQAFSNITTNQWDPGVWHSGAVNCIKILPKSCTVATCSADSTAAFFDIEKNVHTRTFKHQKGLYSMAFSPVMPHCMITSGFEFTPYVWDINARSTRPQLLEDTHDPHTNAIVAVEALFEAPIVLTCDASSKVKSWDLRTMRCIDTMMLDKTYSSKKRLSYNLATSMTNATGSGTVYVSGRCLYGIESSEKTDPMQAYTSACVGIGFDERGGNIITAHEDAVVVWSANTGCINQVHPYTPKIPLGQTRKIKGTETIRAMTLPRNGQFFYIGTSFGRLTVHKLRSSEIVKDTGRLHDVEISQLIAGQTVQGEEYVVSIGCDGSCRTTSDSPIVPPQFSFFHDSPASAVYSAERNLLFVGTTKGQLLSVNMATILSKGPLTKDQVTSDKGEVTAVCILEAFNVAAAATHHGTISFWGIKGAPTIGKELAKIKTPSTPHQQNIPCQHLISIVAGLDCVLVGADGTGRVMFWKVGKKITCNSGRQRREALKHVATRRVFEGDGVAVLDVAASMNIIMAVSFTNQVVFLNSSGEVIGRLCHGRGLANVEWPSGVEPPYSFPSMDNLLGVGQKRSARTIRLIHEFLRRLKKRVLEKRVAASGQFSQYNNSSPTLVGSMVFSRTNTNNFGSANFNNDSQKNPLDLESTQAPPPFSPFGVTKGAHFAHAEHMNQTLVGSPGVATPFVPKFDETFTQVSQAQNSQGSPPSTRRNTIADSEGKQNSAGARGNSSSGTQHDSQPTSTTKQLFVRPPPSGMMDDSVAMNLNEQLRESDVITTTDDDESDVESQFSSNGSGVASLDNTMNEAVKKLLSQKKGRVPLHPAPPPPRKVGVAAAGCVGDYMLPICPRVDPKTGKISDPRGKRNESTKGDAGRAADSVDAARKPPLMTSLSPRALSSKSDNDTSVDIVSDTAKQRPKSANHAANTHHHRPSAASVKKQLKVLHTLSTEDRMDMVNGQLVVMQSRVSNTVVECSTRETPRVMNQQYSVEEAKHRRRRVLLQREPQLRYAMGRESQNEHEQVVGELKRLENEDLNAALKAQQAREEMLKGPPLPAAPVSHRPNSVKGRDQSRRYSTFGK